MAMPSRAFRVDVDALAAAAGCTAAHLSRLLRDAAAQAGGALPLSAQLVLPGRTPPVHVRLPPLRTQCALVVTSQFGYADEGAAHGERRDGEGAAWRADKEERLPNELSPFEGRPLVASCVEQLYEAGIRKLVVVVFEGENGKEIVHAINKTGVGARLELTYVYMPRAQNHGASIIAARSYLPEHFLLVSADHVLSPRLVRRVADFELAADDAGCVALERDLSRVERMPTRLLFDIYASVADSTHVSAVGAASAQADGSLHLTSHPRRGNDGLVAGLMLLTRRVVEALIDLSCLGHQFTLAQAIDPFAQCGQLRYCPVGDDWWISVETFNFHPQPAGAARRGRGSPPRPRLDEPAEPASSLRPLAASAASAALRRKAVCAALDESELAEPLLAASLTPPAAEPPGTILLPPLATSPLEPTLLLVASSLAPLELHSAPSPLPPPLPPSSSFPSSSFPSSSFPSSSFPSSSPISSAPAPASAALSGHLISLPLGAAPPPPLAPPRAARLPLSRRAAALVAPLRRAPDSSPLGLLLGVRGVPPALPHDEHHALLVQLPPAHAEPTLAGGGLALVLLPPPSLPSLPPLPPLPLFPSLPALPPLPSSLALLPPLPSLRSSLACLPPLPSLPSSALPSSVLALSLDAAVSASASGPAPTLRLTLHKRVPLAAWALLSGAVVCGAMQAEMTAWQPAVRSPPLKMAWRLSLAAAALLPFATREVLHARVRRRLRRPATWGWVGVCAFGWVGNLTLFAVALSFAPVPQVALFQNTSPLFLVLFRAASGSRLLRAEAGGTALAMAGAATCGAAAALGGGGGGGGVALLGDSLALLAALCDTAYYVGAKRLRMELPLLLFFWLLFASGALVLALLLLACGQAELSADGGAGIFGWLHPSRLPMQLALFAVGDAGGTINFVAVLQYFDPLVVTVFLLMQPVAATAYEVFSRGADALPGPAKSIGSLMVLCGVLVLVVSSSGEKTEHVEASEVLTELEGPAEEQHDATSSGGESEPGYASVKDVEIAMKEPLI